MTNEAPGGRHGRGWGSFWLSRDLKEQPTDLRYAEKSSTQKLLEKITR